jgi:CubicO group peptidase (beta-lactamase class C family)
MGLHDESALADFARSLRDDDLLIDKGRAFSYSNPGYALAGYLIEQVTGKGYADAMNELVFAPLGMTRTTLRPLSAITYPLATGHSSADQEAPKVVRPLADDTRLWPAGYIFTNVNDLARFIIAIMNDGRIDGRQVLPANIGATLLSAHAEIPTNLFINGKYGYGFFVHDFAGRRMCEHGGELPGYSSEVRILPGQHVAVIILNNGDGVRLNKTFTKAFALMLPSLAFETQPIASAEPRAWPMSAAEIASYVGAYTNRTRIELQAHDGHLFLKQPETDELPVSKIGTDRFCVALPHAPRVQEFLIVTGDDGKPAYLQMGLWVYKRL